MAAHLAADGLFVVEAEPPNRYYRLQDNQYVMVEAVAVDHVRFDVARFDPVTQLLEESHVTLASDGIRLAPIVTRYIWPSEMDLMARIAGLRLRERWGNWTQARFDGDSRNCISVYGRRSN